MLLVTDTKHSEQSAESQLVQGNAPGVRVGPTRYLPLAGTLTKPLLSRGLSLPTGHHPSQGGGD